MIESITFNTAESKIVVTFDDGRSKDYENKQSYLADYPDRVADCDAMNWK